MGMRQFPQRKEFELQTLNYLKELYAAAMRYARNEKDAEDLVQETLLRALAAWEHFQQGTNCRAWLFRILTNNFINEYRRIAREREWQFRENLALSDPGHPQMRDPESVWLEGFIGDEVRHALAALPDDFRQVVILADLNGLSYRDIATKLNLPIGTVMSRLHRARRLLEVALLEYAKELGIHRTHTEAAA
jgi:RNA polymerase sigma-70 factor, ECF subfamily